MHVGDVPKPCQAPVALPRALGLAAVTARHAAGAAGWAWLHIGHVASFTLMMMPHTGHTHLAGSSGSPVVLLPEANVRIRAAPTPATPSSERGRAERDAEDLRGVAVLAPEPAVEEEP